MVTTATPWRTRIEPRSARLTQRGQSVGLHGDADLVGPYAEPKPPGFGFSDTAFRVFVLMATRIRDNDMRSVLLRHLPELGPGFSP